MKLIIAACAIFVILAYLNSSTVSGFACDIYTNVRVLYNANPGPALNKTINTNLNAIKSCSSKKIINDDIEIIKGLLSTPVNIVKYKNAITKLKNDLGIKTKMIFSI